MVYELPFYKNQQGFVGRVVGGWSIAPIFVTGSGLPEEVAPSDNNNQFIYGGGQSFGESDGSNFGALQNAINMCGPGVGGSSRHNNPTVPTSGPLSGIGSSWYGPSQYQNPAAVYSCFRNPILGIDGSNGGGAGVLRGLPYWNVDFSIKKNVKITERFSTEFTAVFTNIFNHNQMSDPLNVLGDVGDWGGLGGLAGVGQANSPRSMEFGLRVRF